MVMVSLIMSVCNLDVLFMYWIMLYGNISRQYIR